MAAAAPLRASPLALTVLFMLAGGPIHPYEMQRRIKLWGKDQVVNVAGCKGFRNAVHNRLPIRRDRHACHRHRRNPAAQIYAELRKKES